jgi:hypothetical protein
MSAPSLTGPGGRLAVLVVALAGLFAMHGLSAHGAAHASREAIGGHADHDMDLPTGVPADEGDHDALLALCLALLVAGVVGLAARGRSVRWSTRDATPALLLTTPWTARRDRDPPDLHALSIRRC